MWHLVGHASPTEKKCNTFKGSGFGCHSFRYDGLPGDVYICIAWFLFSLYAGIRNECHVTCGWMKLTWMWKLSFLYWRDVSNYICIPGNDAHHIFCSCFSLSKCRCQDMSHQPSSWWQHPAEVHLNHILCRCSISSNIHQCVCVCVNFIYSKSHLEIMCIELPTILFQKQQRSSR